MKVGDTILGRDGRMVKITHIQEMVDGRFRIEVYRRPMPVKMGLSWCLRFRLWWHGLYSTRKMLQLAGFVK